jgi:hypothetical protein
VRSPLDALRNWSGCRRPVEEQLEQTLVLRVFIERTKELIVPVARLVAQNDFGQVQVALSDCVEIFAIKRRLDVEVRIVIRTPRMDATLLTHSRGSEVLGSRRPICNCCAGVQEAERLLTCAKARRLWPWVHDPLPLGQIHCSFQGSLYVGRIRGDLGLEPLRGLGMSLYSIQSATESFRPLL